MIDRIEEFYQRIADATVEQLPDNWRRASIEVDFYPESSDYNGEYTTESGKEPHPQSSRFQVLI